MNDEHVALLVEDEPYMAEEITEILAALGHRVLHTESLEEGTELAERGGFCYALMDVQIKRARNSIAPQALAGETLLDRVRRRFPARNQDDKHCLQVLLMSGYVKEHESVVRMLQNGGDDFIRKPLSENPTSLDAKIRTALRKSGRESHDRCACVNHAATGLAGAPMPQPLVSGVRLSLGGRAMRKRTVLQLGDKTAALSTPQFVLALQLVCGRLRGDGVLPGVLGARSRPQQTLQKLGEELAPFLPAGLRVAEAGPDGRFHLHSSIDLGPIDPRCIEGHSDARIKRLAGELARLLDARALPEVPTSVLAPRVRGRQLTITARWRQHKTMVVVDGNELALPPKPYLLLSKLALGRPRRGLGRSGSPRRPRRRELVGDDARLRPPARRRARPGRRHRERSRTELPPRLPARADRGRPGRAARPPALPDPGRAGPLRRRARLRLARVTRW